MKTVARNPMFQEPEPIKYTNRVNIYAFGRPETEEEKQFRNLVQADRHSTFGGRCTVQSCPRKIWENTPLCKQHAYDMWFKVELNKHIEEDHRVHERLRDEAIMRQAKLEDDVEDIRAQQDEALIEEWRKAFEAEERLAKSKTRPGHICYLQVGALIKIGFSSTLDERLRAYPPDSKVLATHPGTPELEQVIHRKFFNHLSHGREWFTPSPEIDRHIQEVREQFPQHNKI